MRDHTNFIATGMMILGALMIFVAATSANALNAKPAVHHVSSLLANPVTAKEIQLRQRLVTKCTPSRTDMLH